ncbi:MAG TPA: GNAT family N-acetyltransferase [Methanoregulaceae archaeon]|nr:GNAT family N-acetyltransferase [Methanoregulaceae archaeon]
MNAIARVTNQRSTIFGCFDHARLVGGYIAYHKRFELFYRSAGSTAPMSSFGGLVVDDDPNRDQYRRYKRLDAIVHAVTQDLRSRRSNYVLFELSPPFLDIRPFIWIGWKAIPCYLYVTSPGAADPSKEARRRIRKAEKAEIVIEQSKDYHAYSTLFSDTYTRQGLEPPLKKEQMVQLLQMVDEAGLGRMWVARTPAGEFAAAEIRLYDEKRTYAWSSASDPELRKNGSSYLLQNTIFHHEALDGFKQTYLFCANVPKLMSFQREFRPELVLYYQVKYIQRPWNYLPFHQISGRSHVHK